MSDPDTAAPLRRDRRSTPIPRRHGWARARWWITTALLALVSAVALITVVIPFILGAETYTVLTGSMRPALEPGALVAVRETPVEAIRTGDIVTYQLRPGEPDVVTHRVIGFQTDADGERMLITRGDANGADDPPVLAVQVRGVLVYAMPHVGYLNVLVSGTTRSTLVIALGAIVIVYGFVILGVDLLRGRLRRRRRQAATPPATWVAVVVAALALGVLSPLAVPSPARAVTAEHPPAGALQLSTDGAVWLSGTPVELFDDAGAVAPGAGIADSLWVRNASGDHARVALVLVWSAANPDAAADLRLTAAGDAVVSGEAWDGGLLAPGESREIPLAVDLSPTSGNDTRGAGIALSGSVRLAQEIGAPLPTGGLPPTGQRLLLGMVLLGGGLLLGGAGLRAAVRGRRPA